MTSVQPAPDPTPLPRIEILRVGTFTDQGGRKHSFSAADLDEISASYDAARDPAPLVVGHPKTDDPAYGWAQGLDVERGVLGAVPEKVEPAFAEMVRAGRFRRVSAQLYPRDHPSNPTPGKFYLKHIGFLGAAAPAVKGLMPVSFSDDADAGCIGFETSLKEAFMSDDGGEISLAEQKDALDKREANLKAREDKIAADAKAAQHADFVSFADGQIKAGRLRPADRESVIHVLDQLGGPDVISFGEGDKAVSAVDVFKGFFAAAQPVISFGELPGGKPAKGATISFAAPQGHEIDQARAALHAAAVALQAEDPNLDYVTAVKRAEAAA